jgi:hypothetical protein
MFSSDVAVLSGGLVIWSVKEQGLLIETVFQDGFNALERIGLDAQSTCAGGLKTLRGVSASQAHDSETGSKALLGMGSILQDMSDKLTGVGADLLGPVQES